MNFLSLFVGYYDSKKGLISYLGSNWHVTSSYDDEPVSQTSNFVTFFLFSCILSNITEQLLFYSLSLTFTSSSNLIFSFIASMLIRSQPCSSTFLLLFSISSEFQLSSDKFRLKILFLSPNFGFMMSSNLGLATISIFFTFSCTIRYIYFQHLIYSLKFLQTCYFLTIFFTETTSGTISISYSGS